MYVVVDELRGLMRITSFKIVLYSRRESNFQLLVKIKEIFIISLKFCNLFYL